MIHAVTLAVIQKNILNFSKITPRTKKTEIKKGSNGIDFQNYANRIKCLKNLKRSADLWLKKREMVTTSVMKTKFSQINYTRFYFPNSIPSLPYRHPSHTEISDFKTEK